MPAGAGEVDGRLDGGVEHLGGEHAADREGQQPEARGLHAQRPGQPEHEERGGQVDAEVALVQNAVGARRSPPSESCGRGRRA